MCFYVYCFTCQSNGKEYVGWTSKSVEERWAEHVKASKNSRCHFHQAIRKYGPAAFAQRILDVVMKAETAKAVEKLWISFLATNESRDGHRGYNMTDGGDGCVGNTWSQESRRKLSNSNKGRRHSQPTREKLRMSVLRHYLEHGTRSHNEESRRVMSESHNAIKKPVKQFGLNGELIAVHASIAIAAKAINHPDSTKIGLCCRGQRKTSNGFRWQYA